MLIALGAGCLRCDVGLNKIYSMLPFLLLAVFCCLASYGLQKRAAWVWYAGWGMLFLGAGLYGTFTFSALYSAQTSMAVLAAWVYIGGGALLWIPAAVWWCARRNAFGRRTPTPSIPRVPPQKPGPAENK
jgi:hypothetical protein